jgi:DNA-binding beta-propeller fold protein YncE
MKYLFNAMILITGLCCLVAAQGREGGSQPQKQEDSQYLKLVQKIPLPGVEGRIDHMSVDVKGKRLFMAGLGNGTVEVIDLEAGKPIHSITGLGDPQAALYVPETNLIFVADGDHNAVYVYDGATYQLIRTVPSLENADNLRIDRRSIRTYGVPMVIVGYGEDAKSALRAMDSRDGKPMWEIPLDGHPESFQLEKTVDGKIFINIPTAGHVAVVQERKRRVTEKWPMPEFKPFYPMALDEANHRVFIGSRVPPKLVVFDGKSGQRVTTVDGVAQADDLFYDAAHKRLYMSSGEGVIGVFEQRDADHYELVAKIPSVPGAPTSLFVPEFNRLYVPAPSYEGRPTTVLVYEVQP